MNKESDIDTSVDGPSSADIIRPEAESDSSSDGIISAHAKKARKQTFRAAWLKDPQFQSWLERTEDPLQAKCTVCVKFFRAVISVLKEHANTKTHSVNMQRKAAASLSVPSNAAISSADAENDSSSADNLACPPAKKLKSIPGKQAFCKSWLTCPHFRLWLQETEDPYKAKCTVCSKFLRAKKSDLLSHADTAMHMMTMQRKAGASISAPSNAAATSVDTSIARPANAAVSSSDAEIDSSADVSIAGPSGAAAAITSSGTENDSSVGSTFVVPVAMDPTTAKTLNRKQAFRQICPKDPQLQLRLQKTENPHKAKYTLCPKFIIAGKSHLQQHAITGNRIVQIQQKAGASISVPSDANTTSIDASVATPANAAISSSDAQNDSSSASTFIVPVVMNPRTAKTLNRKQVIREICPKDPQFQLRLQKTDTLHKAKYTLCPKFIIAGKSQLQQHAITGNRIMHIEQKPGASISVPSDANTTSTDASVAKPASVATPASVAKPANAAISSSDAQNDSSNDSTSIVPAAKQARRTIHQAGPEAPHVKPRLQQAHEPHKLKCTVCSKFFRPKTSHLEQHAKTDIRVTNVQQKAGASISVPSNAAISSSDTENDSSSAVTCSPAKTPNSANRLDGNPGKQAFRKSWLKYPPFQLWLQETEDPYKAKCTVCSKFLRAKKSDLLQHADTAMHIMTMQQKAGASVSVPSNAGTTSIDTSSARPGNAAISCSDAQNNSSANVSIAGPSSAAADITSSGTENDSSSVSTFIVPVAMNPGTAKTLNTNQAFRKICPKDPQFQLRLQKAGNPHKAKYTLGPKFIIAGKSHLHQHAITGNRIVHIQQKPGASISVPSDANTTSSDTSFARPANAAISSSDAQNDSSADVSIAGPSGAGAAITSSGSGSTFIIPAAMNPRTAKTLNRKQTFRKIWPKNAKFQLCLQKIENPHKAKYTLGPKFIIAGKNHLQQHAITGNRIMHIQQKPGASISVPSDAVTTSIDTSFATPANAAISSSDAQNDSSADVSIAGPSSAACTITDGDNDSSSDSTFIVPAANEARWPPFHQVWLKDPHFQPSLQQADDPLKAKCTVSEAHITNIVHPKEELTSTVKGTFADNVQVEEVTICIDATEPGRSFQSCSLYPRQNGEDKRQCQVDEVPSTSSASEAASTRTRRNGETPTTTRPIHPIVHDHQYAKIPGSMWRKMLVLKKQIQTFKRERHIYKQHNFRLKKQVTSLKRIVNKFRSTRALPDSGLEKGCRNRISRKNFKQDVLEETTKPTFRMFPKNGTRRQLWVNSLELDELRLYLNTAWYASFVSRVRILRGPPCRAQGTHSARYRRRDQLKTHGSIEGSRVHLRLYIWR